MPAFRDLCVGLDCGSTTVRFLRLVRRGSVTGVAVAAADAVGHQWRKALGAGAGAGRGAGFGGKVVPDNTLHWILWGIALRGCAPGNGVDDRGVARPMGQMNLVAGPMVDHPSDIPSGVSAHDLEALDCDRGLLRFRARRDYHRRRRRALDHKEGDLYIIIRTVIQIVVYLWPDHRLVVFSCCFLPYFARGLTLLLPRVRILRA